jgi:hypothetical protein
MNKQFVFAILVLLFANVLADGDKDEKRKLSVDVKSDEVDIDSELESDTKNKFRFTLSTKDSGLRVDVRSEAEKSDDYKIQRELRVYFQSVVAYDSKQTSAYSGGATVGNAYDLSAAKWNPFACPLDASTGKYTCTAQTTDGVFTGKFEFSGQSFVSNQSMTFGPDDIKITVIIDSFKYDGSANSDTRLALGCIGKASVDYKDKDPSGKSHTVNTGGSAFSWSTSATADGATVDVLNSDVTFADDGGDKKFALWFSFAASKPNNVNWDPVVSTDDSASSVLVPMASLIVLLAAIVQWM